MRCSSCEPLLADYLEGTLRARRMAVVARHVHGCAGCTALVEELKVVDALLATATVPSLPENFTFAVMAHARSMPVPVRRLMPVWMAVGAYLLAVWLLAGGWFLLRGTGAIAAVERALAPFGSGLIALADAGLGAGHALAPDPIAVGAIVGGVLLLDVLALAGLFYFYRHVRPRRLASVSLEVRR
ncbi:MAG TPA: zf-HC2 domain-containing protein [Candidatus Baltobacteraceae bacterium]|jgi:anti-sigma factor RsiW